ncbi:MAG TPA: gluconate 2-dehydrogenase subunit 3 family protein [Ktedonobacterales bacterium]
MRKTKPDSRAASDGGDAVRREESERAPGAKEAQAHVSPSLPINPTTGEPHPPPAHPGFYPGYATLSQQNFWDEATRALVLARVNEVPPIRFFQGDEVALARAVFDRLLPQEDRDESRRIPVLNYVDNSYYLDETSGYRYASMPNDREAIRLGLKGIDAVARHMYATPFVALAAHEQEEVLQTLRDGNPPAGQEYWTQMDVCIFWLQLVSRACDAYYAHPYAWAEIGFGGPAYPRGYMRLQGGQPEPWEVAERRYPWAPPPDMPSSQFHPYHEERRTQTPGHARVPPSPGQGGTH